MTNETCNFYDLWMLHAPIANDRFGSKADVGRCDLGKER